MVIVALDQGTSSSRALVIDEKGTIIAQSQREFTQFFPQEGWVEHDPEEIWSSQIHVLLEAIEKAHLSPRSIQAIGITNQRETTIIWDRKTSRPIYPAIVWQDRRTAAACETLPSDLIHQKTGLVADPYFSATKISWILDHVPGARERAEKGELAFGTVDSWLVWKLTSGRSHVTDMTNASRTMLFNLHTLSWDEELLSLMRIPPSLLPRITKSAERVGEVSSTFLASKPPICALIGDQQAALFGQQCVEPGMAKCTYGTGCFLLMNIGEKPLIDGPELITTVAYALKEKVVYAIEGSIFIGGAVVQWLRDELHLISDAEEIERLARQVKDSGGISFIPALSGLGAPYWDPHAKGAILGITRGTRSAHVARAALEGIAFQVDDLISQIERSSGFSLTELRVDGGAARNLLLMQIQSNIMQKKLIKPEYDELTGIGAAYLAGLEVGLWDEVSSLWRGKESFHPQENISKERWKKGVAAVRLYAKK